MKLVDMRDSKSLVREDVSVRVRPLYHLSLLLDPKDFFDRFQQVIGFGCNWDVKESDLESALEHYSHHHAFSDSSLLSNTAQPSILSSLITESLIFAQPAIIPGLGTLSPPSF